MKPKRPFIFITFLIVLNGTTHTFFNATRKVSFSKFMNKLQWAALIIPPLKELGLNIFVTQLYKGLPDADQFKSDYLKYGSKSLSFTEEELNKTNSTYIHNVIQDSSVAVKYHGNIEYQVGADHDFITGKKYIILPYNCYIPEGILCHEYGHIKHNHSVKKAVFHTIAPVLFHTIFKKALTVYKGLKYGVTAVQNRIPSIGSTFLKIPSTMATLSVAHLATHYQSRKHEREADDAIPNQYAFGAAQYIEFAQGIINKKTQQAPKTWYGDVLEDCPALKNQLEKLLTTHPSADERVDKLRARATGV